MGYKTPNEDSHVCIYCDVIVGAGEGVLLKYSPTQPDDAIVKYHFSDRAGHLSCVEAYGSLTEQEALIES